MFIGTLCRKSHHQRRVEEFMLRAEQVVPTQIIIPNEDVRRLRAKLILEEALETVDALGFVARVHPRDRAHIMVPVKMENMTLSDHRHGPDLELICDGCADIKVVTTGTLSAFGAPDEVIQEEVDAANLQKFSKGGHRREDGKWIKPADWTPPDIKGILSKMGWPTSESKEA